MSLSLKLKKFKVANQGDGHHWKILAKFSISLVPNTHISILIIRGHDALCTFISAPWEDKTARTPSIPGPLHPVQLCPSPFWVDLAPLLYPGNLSMNPLELMAGPQQNSPQLPLLLWSQCWLCSTEIWLSLSPLHLWAYSPLWSMLRPFSLFPPQPSIFSSSPFEHWG